MFTRADNNGSAASAAGIANDGTTAKDLSFKLSELSTLSIVLIVLCASLAVALIALFIIKRQAFKQRICFPLFGKHQEHRSQDTFSCMDEIELPRETMQQQQAAAAYPLPPPQSHDHKRTNGLYLLDNYNYQDGYSLQHTHDLTLQTHDCSLQQQQQSRHNSMTDNDQQQLSQQSIDPILQSLARQRESDGIGYYPIRDSRKSSTTQQQQRHDDEDIIDMLYVTSYKVW